jgi:acyl-CoA hydrolase/RimJ/RimL family protein N-acetyltransferase
MADTALSAPYNSLQRLQETYPEKFAPVDAICRRIRRGQRLFIGTACSEPRYLVDCLAHFADRHPKAFFDVEVHHVWPMRELPLADRKFARNFRLNLYYIGPCARQTVHRGLADYTPVFLSEAPLFLQSGIVHIDVALIQTSLPDPGGYVSLGINVDIVRAALDNAGLVVAQINAHMPRTRGATLVHVTDLDYVVPHDEPLPECPPAAPDPAGERIGRQVAEIVRNGDTLQIGCGSLNRAVCAQLKGKRHLGIHTEVLTDGIVELMQAGAVDNTCKSIDRGKTVASLCMASRATYAYIADNPAIELHPVNYTNSPVALSRQNHMVAINAALQIDLTGQASAESIGGYLYSGAGGQADCMRGAALAGDGKTVLVVRSATGAPPRSRIVPQLDAGTGVTLTRADVQYVVTEYGSVFLRGKSLRERAMALIAIAHPAFRPWLIDRARHLGLIYPDQAFVPGPAGEYPEHLEARCTTHRGVDIFLRPVRISDETLVKDFFYALSDRSFYRRFLSMRRDMPHALLQEWVAIDYSRKMVLLAMVPGDQEPVIAGIGEYSMHGTNRMADVAFIVRDEYQNRGIGSMLLLQLCRHARRGGLAGFTAEVLTDNTPMLHIFDKAGFETHTIAGEQTCTLVLYLRGP